MINYSVAKVLRLIILTLLVLTVALAGTGFAAEVFLRAATVQKTMPDGTVITMWGYAQDSSFGALDGVVSVPGPPITVPAGDNTLTIHLDNDLSTATSLIIPGQITTMTPARNSDGRVRSFTHETYPENSTATDYTWSNLKPGTYIYQSGTHPAVQIQMGLYGALKHDFAAGQAYDDAGTAYDSDVTLLYSEIDPVIVNAVTDGNYGPGKAITSTIGYKPKFFLVNGEPFTPGSSPVLAGTAGDDILIRFLNAGLKSHVPTLNNGAYMSIVAEDGNLLPFAKEQYSLWLPAGKTMDAMISPAEGYYAVFDRMLNLTNSGDGPGGHMTFMDVSAATTYALIVGTGGTGTGLVLSVSSPGGINCGTDCTENYNNGTEVTLEAQPATGSVLNAWSGACTGTGTCVVTMSTARNVTASFMASTGIGVFNAGNWTLDTNGNGVLDAGDTTITFGNASFTPVTGDWNGDGTTDTAVYNDGWFYIDSNGNNVWEPGTDAKFKFGNGNAGLIPITGDWNGDGTTDVGLFMDGWWYIDSNANQVWESGVDVKFRFGNGNFTPVTGDWNGDGTTDVGLYLNGNWYLDSDGDRAWNPLTDTKHRFGNSSFTPIPGDWNSDGITDIGLFKNGMFYLDTNGNGLWEGSSIDALYTYGSAGDTPVSGIW